jgi:hypothetical protein
MENNNNNMHLSSEQIDDLILTLKTRFEENMDRHEGIKWPLVNAKLDASPGKLWSINEMERTGGEPDVVGYDNDSGEFIFYDCSPESPEGRRSLCYDQEALEARKKNKPEGSAMEMASTMGIELLTEEQYRALQKLGEFDIKTSSWLKTPSNVRDLGGAIFGDRRFDRVFIYHNGADSYYSARGFRGWIRV